MSEIAGKEPFALTPDEASRVWSLAAVGSADECWPWKGSTIPKDGRGTLTLRGRTYLAPRVVLADRSGFMPPPSVFACHTCDNPNCVNPAHLWWGGARENAMDAKAKGRCTNQRLTECVHGHPLTEGHVYWIRGGTARLCRQCSLIRRVRNKAIRIAKRQEAAHVG